MHLEQYEEDSASHYNSGAPVHGTPSMSARSGCSCCKKCTDSQQHPIGAVLPSLNKAGLAGCWMSRKEPSQGKLPRSAGTQLRALKGSHISHPFAPKMRYSALNTE